MGQRCAGRLRLPRGGARLVQPPRTGVAAVDYDGGGVLHRNAGGRLGALRQAGNIRSSLAKPSPARSPAMA
jgi:hypothetical protein